MSLNQSVAEAGHSNSGAAAAPVGMADSGAMEKLDLTLEEIIGAGDRKEGQSNSRTGASTRHGRRPIGARHDTRNAQVRRPGRAETLVNLKFAGSINKRRNPMTAMTHGAISQHYQRNLAHPRSMLAAKAFQQLPGIAAAQQNAIAYHHQQQHQYPQTSYTPLVSGYTALGVSGHLLVPAVAPGSNGSYVCLPQPNNGSSKYGQHQGSRLSAQDAALLSTEVIQEENGDTIVRFKQTDLVKVKAGTGDMILTSGGYRTFSTKAVLNQALQPVGLWVDDSTAPPATEQSEPRGSTSHEGQSGQCQKSSSPEWVVTDRRLYLATFVDGMTIKQAGALNKAQMVARGSVIAQYLRQRKYDAEQKAARLSNGKGGRRRYISGSEGGEKEGCDGGTLTSTAIKTEAPPSATPTVYQHQALESVNEDLDQMAE